MQFNKRGFNTDFKHTDYKKERYDIPQRRDMGLAKDHSVSFSFYVFFIFFETVSPFVTTTVLKHIL